MDINVLTLNVGNTRLAVGAFVAGELSGVERVSLEDRAGWTRAIEAGWAKIAGREGAAIAGASVNPQGMEIIEHVISETLRQPVEWVGRNLDLPIKVLTQHPNETGVDRVLNVAAAFEQLQRAVVVIDAGTAITVDLCNDRGEFLGGAIAPGVAMQLDALHERTARLPRVEFDVPPAPYGRSTAEAINHGVYHGVRGMVKELIENYATELGYWPEVIATGGDAKTLFEGWELINGISQDLTMYGIALAYAEHHIKHGT
jgi:type III pantothenate kinase